MEEIDKIVERIKVASPLELPFVIMEAETYDRQTSYELYEEISKQFEGEGIIDNVVSPVLATIVDGVLALRCFKGVNRKMGLSAQRVMQECRNFNYDGQVSFLMPDSFVESKNNAETKKLWGQENRAEYIREKYENTSAMGQYKKGKIKENGNRVNMEDEYLLTKDITGTKARPDLRRDDPKHELNAETDHIVPLKKVFDEFQNNCGLSDGDIRDIANQDYNFAVTGRKINNPKRDRTNSEFIKWQDEKKANGEPYVELSEKQRKNMIKMEKEATAAINNAVNDTVAKNLLGQGKADRKEREEAYTAKKQELGRKLKPEERAKVDKDLALKKAKDIHIGNAMNAGQQSLLYMAGNVIILVMKPLYYEIKDMIMNGVLKGVCANGYKEAIKIRFTRIKNYVWGYISSLKGMMGSALDMLKDFISALIEGIIGMFVGMFKQILRVVKEGVKIGMQAYSVLFGEESKSKSAAEKGDAIIKIVGSSAVALCGIGINYLLEKIPMLGEEGREVLSVLLSGLASVLLFYALDKADLFNVKKDKREKRLNEIFEMRIKDIQENVAKFNEAAIETMRSHYMTSRALLDSIKEAAENENYAEMNTLLVKYRTFMNPESTSTKPNWNC